MTDILVTVRREQVGTVIGHLTATDLRRAERALLTLLGFGG